MQALGTSARVGASIDLEDLRYGYGDGEFELRVPALRVEACERVAVIGPSGSGKTTLLHLIAGIVVPLAGRVCCDDVEISALDDAKEFELLDYLSVRDNILLPYRIHPALQLGASVIARADSLADRVGLRSAKDRLVTRLSHGERQRVAVCRALVAEPCLLLCDEPTGNLDPANKLRVLDILMDVVAECGATLMAVTHDHDLLPRFSRVIDMKSLLASGEEPA
ncbi:MAG: ATP-binding cassette domain-containing protein [Deltaproteobacteria bacterium]|nr:ATP-binding cassette domain-containing protein [Deltaproteobacteria bacterium]